MHNVFNTWYNVAICKGMNHYFTQDNMILKCYWLIYLYSLFLLIWNLCLYQQRQQSCIMNLYFQSSWGECNDSYAFLNSLFWMVTFLYKDVKNIKKCKLKKECLNIHVRIRKPLSYKHELSLISQEITKALKKFKKIFQIELLN